jgi:hypothetical protein
MRKLVYAPAKALFVGHLENAKDKKGLYVGVHLDDAGWINIACIKIAWPDYYESLAVGTTDGTFRGHQYFTTHRKHGKFIPANKVVSVLDNTRRRECLKFDKIALPIAT